MNYKPAYNLHLPDERSLEDMSQSEKLSEIKPPLVGALIFFVWLYNRTNVRNLDVLGFSSHN